MLGYLRYEWPLRRRSKLRLYSSGKTELKSSVEGFAATSLSLHFLRLNDLRNECILRIRVAARA